MPFIIEALASRHDRKGFSCGVPPLDRYLKEQAGQDIKRRAALCYIAHEPESDRIAGYYTLSAGDVALQDIPDDVARRLPRYPVVPVARVGRLAIDTEFQGKRLGAAMLWDAAQKAMRAELGVFALAVDAKDEQAAAFYRHSGFIALQPNSLRLFLPLQTIASLR
ncbi:GNAT family N-acetyltransferase [Methylobrevis pamukkalensis]|uniref:Acetyltransferase (GNAT) family protein n=1 Tax=Methylobrevis pamukkalensis TaxID=1439726 RepID=A0A1E3H6R4_9HYPH|nr:GNAT family N-acetyltransferase [Methylobrevis pamukkalensis]ODN72012.1 Acetyltransferase (GNAT) family protein [Methylobrevis pamukkalensis]